MPYFYTPEHIILKINGKYHSQGTILKLEGNNDFDLTTEIPKIPERLPYTGKEVTPKELPFYFLELYQENQLAVIFLSDQIRTVHFPTNTPITFRIITQNVYGEYKLTLRGDDISLVESVKLITVVNDNHEAKSQIVLNADKDKVFTSPILKNDQKETIFRN